VENKEEKKPRVKPIIEAADSLSLGISIVVAIFLGIGIGVVLKNTTGVSWTLWIGVAIGIAAAILNIYKAYSKEYKEYEALAQERQAKIDSAYEDDEDEDYSGTKY
jgi:F0F1-type ATP synthase assembly protein I